MRFLLLGHDHISHDDEAVTLPGIFENGEKSVTAARVAKFRPSVITGASDKVQMIGAISAMESGRHDGHGKGVVVPALAKNARTGHPTFQNGKERSR